MATGRALRRRALGAQERAVDLDVVLQREGAGVLAAGLGLVVPVEVGLQGAVHDLRDPLAVLLGHRENLVVELCVEPSDGDSLTGQRFHTLTC